jgi:hypothetical protein
MSLATHDRLMPASSRSFSSRSRLPGPFLDHGLAVRVRLRSARIGRGGTKLGRTRGVLDQLADPGRIRHIGLAAGHVAQVPGAQQPARHGVLEQVVDRLPVGAGRLHAHDGDPSAGQPVPQATRPLVVVANVRVCC